MTDTREHVTITIDGTQVSVPKGTNLIDAAARVGIDIPHYCYHPHLSVAGNCRMCQVAVEGSPKLTIACNTGATQGMVVRTQRVAPDVADAQRATLEFLLINHPLDCTVCDQAGHCKLQDYYYQYNSKPSRFIENKVNKVKAEVLGPEVIYDGERCILCTRCVRFCEEVTSTGELGVENRGDHSVIAISPGQELNNALSATVVDLCPVGALTHRRWRFNTRIWYTDQVDSICNGCSTGCNVKVATRDGKVVHVKARLNSAVNKEWMCDEGRYGFERFQKQPRLDSPQIRRPDDSFESVTPEKALADAAQILKNAANGRTAMFLSPQLTLEEIWLSLQLAEKLLKIPNEAIFMQSAPRALSEVERVLISPDRAPNVFAGAVLGLAGKAADPSRSEKVDPGYRDRLQAKFLGGLDQLAGAAFKNVLVIGDQAIPDTALNPRVRDGIKSADTIYLGTTPPDLLEGRSVQTGVEGCARILLPSRTLIEKSGVLINSQGRFQRAKRLLVGPIGSLPDWMWIGKLSEHAGVELLPKSVTDERALFREMVKRTPKWSELTLTKIGGLGIALSELEAVSSVGQTSAMGASA